MVLHLLLSCLILCQECGPSLHMPQTRHGVAIGILRLIHVSRSGSTQENWHGSWLRLAHQTPDQRSSSPSLPPAMVSAARKIRIVTECSGLEPLPYVLDRLGLAGRYEMAAACEIDPVCRRVIRLCHTGSARPQKMFKDISLRRPRELPDHDLYVAGFPCQPFSTMGARQGVRDARGRGLIINHIISALAAKRPRAFLWENVRGLVSQHRATFEDILQQLRHMAGSAYKVGFKIIDTADLGIPQHRERVYIVGLLRAAMVPGFSFTWPTPRERKSLPRALGWRKKPDKRKARKREKRFLANATPKLRQRLKKALQDIRRKGVDPRDMDQPVAVDIDGSKPHWMHGISPCLTRARASTGHYLPVLGRRLTIPERLRLQALPVDIHARCEGNVSDRQLGAMIGNSLSLNVVGALVSQMLVACGLAAECQRRPA